MLTASILMAKVWEPPHVPKTHAESHLSQHVLDFGVPRWPLVVAARLGRVGSVHGGQLSLGAALAKPGSVLQTVQGRLLILLTQNIQRPPLNICSAAEVNATLVTMVTVALLEQGVQHKWQLGQVGAPTGWTRSRMA